VKTTQVVLASVSLALAIGCTCARAGQPIDIANEPQLGASFAISDKSNMQMIAAGQISPARLVRHAGIEYTVAVDRSSHIIYIATSDPAFKTPESFTVTSTLAQLLTSGIPQPWQEPGWAYHTALPSGWQAAFTIDLSTESSLRPESHVDWFFKRR